MKKQWKTAALLSLALQSVPAADLELALKSRIAQGPGKVFLAAKNLKTGKSIALQGNEPVRTASTIKLPILIELYAEAAEGKLKLDDEVPLRPNDIVSGSGVLHEFTPGARLKLRDVANLMIVVSDNSATNVLIERLTADAVNARLDTLGLPTTRLMRKVRGDGNNLSAPQGWSKAGLLEANKRFGLGSSTPWDMVKLLEALDAGKLVNPEASKAMLAILKRQQDNGGILRKSGSLVVANKTGALDHLRSDVGIVYSPAGPIAMAITVEDIPKVDYGPDNPGLLLIADLAKLLWEGLAQ